MSSYQGSPPQRDRSYSTSRRSFLLIPKTMDLSNGDTEPRPLSAGLPKSPKTTKFGSGAASFSLPHGSPFSAHPRSEYHPTLSRGAKPTSAGRHEGGAPEGFPVSSADAAVTALMMTRPASSSRTNLAAWRAYGNTMGPPVSSHAAMAAGGHPGVLVGGTGHGGSLGGGGRPLSARTGAAKSPRVGVLAGMPSGVYFNNEALSYSLEPHAGGGGEGGGDVPHEGAETEQQLLLTQPEHEQRQMQQLQEEQRQEQQQQQALEQQMQQEQQHEELELKQQQLDRHAYLHQRDRMVRPGTAPIMDIPEKPAPRVQVQAPTDHAEVFVHRRRSGPAKMAGGFKWCRPSSAPANRALVRVGSALDTFPAAGDGISLIGGSIRVSPVPGQGRWAEHVNRKGAASSAGHLTSRAVGRPHGGINGIGNGVEAGGAASASASNSPTGNGKPNRSMSGRGGLRGSRVPNPTAATTAGETTPTHPVLHKGRSVLPLPPHAADLVDPQDISYLYPGTLPTDPLAKEQWAAELRKAPPHMVAMLAHEHHRSELSSSNVYSGGPNAKPGTAFAASFRGSAAAAAAAIFGYGPSPLTVGPKSKALQPGFPNRTPVNPSFLVQQPPTVAMSSWLPYHHPAEQVFLAGEPPSPPLTYKFENQMPWNVVLKNGGGAALAGAASDILGSSPPGFGFGSSGLHGAPGSDPVVVGSTLLPNSNSIKHHQLAKQRALGRAREAFGGSASRGKNRRGDGGANGKSTSISNSRPGMSQNSEGAGSTSSSSADRFWSISVQETAALGSVLRPPVVTGHGPPTTDLIPSVPSPDSSAAGQAWSLRLGRSKLLRLMSSVRSSSIPQPPSAAAASMAKAAANSAATAAARAMQCAPPLWGQPPQQQRQFAEGALANGRAGERRYGTNVLSDMYDNYGDYVSEGDGDNMMMTGLSVAGRLGHGTDTLTDTRGAEDTSSNHQGVDDPREWTQQGFPGEEGVPGDAYLDDPLPVEGNKGVLDRAGWSPEEGDAFDPVAGEQANGGFGEDGEPSSHKNITSFGGSGLSDSFPIRPRVRPVSAAVRRGNPRSGDASVAGGLAIMEKEGLPDAELLSGEGRFVVEEPDGAARPGGNDNNTSSFITASVDGMLSAAPHYVGRAADEEFDALSALHPRPASRSERESSADGGGGSFDKFRPMRNDALAVMVSRIQIRGPRPPRLQVTAAAGGGGEALDLDGNVIDAGNGAERHGLPYAPEMDEGPKGG